MRERKGNNSSFNVKAYCEANPALVYYGLCRNYQAALLHCERWPRREIDRWLLRAACSARRSACSTAPGTPWRQAFTGTWTTPQPLDGAIDSRRFLLALRQALSNKDNVTSVTVIAARAPGKSFRLFCGLATSSSRAFRFRETDELFRQGSPGRQTLPCIYPLPQTPITVPSRLFQRGDLPAAGRTRHALGRPCSRARRKSAASARMRTSTPFWTATRSSSPTWGGLRHHRRFQRR